MKISDIILFKYPLTQSKYEFIFGEIIENLGDSVKVKTFDSEFIVTNETLTVSNLDIVCNLYTNPRPGIIYGKEIKTPPIQKMYEGNLIYIYLPFEYRQTQEMQDSYCSKVVNEFTSFYKKIKMKKELDEKCFEFHFRVGNFEKSNFSKKSKNDLHGTFEIYSDLSGVDVLKEGIAQGFSYYFWNQSSKDTMSSWLKYFSDQFTLERIERRDVENLFIECLEKPKKDLTDLSSQDFTIFNLILKEISRVKYLSAKELKLIQKKIGSDYILKEILPSAINALSIEGVVVPPIKTNAKKLFLETCRSFLTERSNEASGGLLNSLLEEFLN